MEKNIREFLSPQEYFNMVKDKKQRITDKELEAFYDSCLILLNKYKVTKQIKGMRKLIFHIENIEKEREIVAAGVDTFVYREDIEEYIDDIANDVVKIIELRNYEREIPDEIVNVIEKVGDKFDELYVLFTDYTGKVEKQVEKERREKDPILFGVFQDNRLRSVNDRFYFLGDWIDEYCDLTLDKMVATVKKEKNKDIAFTISTPTDIQELKAQLDALDSNNRFTFNALNLRQKEEHPTMFDKIRTFLTKKEK